MRMCARAVLTLNLLMVTAVSLATAAPTKKPNILILLADDVGFPALVTDAWSSIDRTRR